tara:strand:- start:49 stop:990 length:942 start_codon:yes stop_codon:yes gene_type:complete
MSKVLIFGAGLRTKDTILPALSLAASDFDADFVTLSGNQLAMKNKKTKCFKFGFSKIDYSKYDLIIISVPQTEVCKVIDSIDTIRDTKVMIDTPVTRNIYVKTKNTSIKVMEDIIFLPFNDLIRNYGKIKKIVMRYSGYQYHGVALAKNLINEKVVKSKSIRNVERDEIIINFAQNKKVEIKNPRNYEKGYIEIIYEGDERLVLGNKQTYEKFENSQIYIHGENLFFQNKDYKEKIQPLKENINTNNFVESIHFFKLLGLSSMFYRALNSAYEELPNISSCYEDYKITHNITLINRLKWKYIKIKRKLISINT